MTPEETTAPQRASSSTVFLYPFCPLPLSMSTVNFCTVGCKKNPVDRNDDDDDDDSRTDYISIYLMCECELMVRCIWCCSYVYILLPAYISVVRTSERFTARSLCSFRASCTDRRSTRSALLTVYIGRDHEAHKKAQKSPQEIELQMISSSTKHSKPVLHINPLMPKGFIYSLTCLNLLILGACRVKDSLVILISCKKNVFKNNIFEQ